MSHEMSRFVDCVKCGICQGTFMKPICLPCGHLFCEECFDLAPTTTHECPTCRQKLRRKMPTRVYGIDDMIDAVDSLLPEDVKEERMARKRAAEEAATNASKKVKTDHPRTIRTMVHATVSTAILPLLDSEGEEELEFLEAEDEMFNDLEDPEDPDWEPTPSDEEEEADDDEEEEEDDDLCC